MIGELDMTMVAITPDLASVLGAELGLMEERKPRHTIQVDGAHQPGLYVVGAIQNRPGFDGVGRRHIAYFRQVER